ncbi:MAG: hypothetical protein AB4368_24455 [Xenococcaceae cyanobacterium]
MNTSNKIKFITTNDRQGKVVLQYLNKTCQQALNYCQNNNLQSYEDFARTIKVIGDKNAQSKGKHLAIRVGVKENDLVLSLASKPQIGTTKSIKMLEHLGSEDKYQYTRSTVEGLLQKKEVQQNSDLNLQELADFSSFSVNETDLTPRSQKNSRLDFIDLIEAKNTSAFKEVSEDLLFEAEEPLSRTSHVEDVLDELLNEYDGDEKVNINEQKSSANKQQKQSDIVVKKAKKNRALPSIAERASKTLLALGRRADSYTQDTDGMTVMAASLKMGAVGIAFANKLLENREERKLKATIDRILTAQERTSQLVDRSLSLKQKSAKEEPEIDSEQDLNDELEIDDNLDTDVEIELDDELDLDNELELDDEIEPDNDLDLENDITEQLDKAVKTIDRQIVDIDPNISSETIVIERSADFFEQLEQINAALDRLEQKLDSLEERIERLEQLLDKQEKGIKNHDELVSENNKDSDFWDEDDSSQSDEVEVEDLDTQLVNVLLDVSEKYEQINPNPNSSPEIPIGDSCRLYSERNEDKTIITIEERDNEEVAEIFKVTIENDKDEFVIDKDELEEDEKQAIVAAFSQKLEEIDNYLDKQQKQAQSKKQKQIAMVD